MLAESTLKQTFINRIIRIWITIKINMIFSFVNLSRYSNYRVAKRLKPHIIKPYRTFAK